MVSDTWAVGDAYEKYVGRWSRRVADEFIRWLDVAPGGSWLDVGCGTGALTATVLNRADPANIIGVDTSDGFLADARNLIVDPRVTFRSAARRRRIHPGRKDGWPSRRLRLGLCRGHGDDAVVLGRRHYS